MKVFIEAQVKDWRFGCAAYDHRTGLTGYGIDEESALDSLQRAVAAWCNGLSQIGFLETSLTKKSIPVEPAGEGIIVVVKPK